MMIDNKKQWYLLILATIWLFILLCLIAWMFSISRDTSVLSLAALTAPLIGMLRQIYRYHFPSNIADYELLKLKHLFKIKRE